MKKLFFIFIFGILVIPFSVYSYDINSNIVTDIKYNKSTLTSFDTAKAYYTISDNCFDVVVGTNDWPVFNYSTYYGITVFPVTVTNKNCTIPGQILVNANIIVIPTISFFWVSSALPLDDSWVIDGPGSQITITENGIGKPSVTTITAQDSKDYNISDLVSTVFGYNSTLFEYRQANQSLKTAGISKLDTIQSSSLVNKKVILPNKDYLTYFPIDISKNTINLDIAHEMATPSSLIPLIDKMTWFYESTAYIESIFEVTTTVKIASPSINVKENGIKLDTLVSSKQYDNSDIEWYGTFQIKKEGSSSWEDINPNFMNFVTTQSLQEEKLNFDQAYNNAKIRYKYVHSYDINKMAYSEEKTITIMQITNPDTSDTIINDIIIMIISSLSIISLIIVLKRK